MWVGIPEESKNDCSVPRVYTNIYLYIYPGWKIGIQWMDANFNPA